MLFRSPVYEWMDKSSFAEASEDEGIEDVEEEDEERGSVVEVEK